MKVDYSSNMHEIFNVYPIRLVVACLSSEQVSKSVDSLLVNTSKATGSSAHASGSGNINVHPFDNANDNNSSNLQPSSPSAYGQVRRHSFDVKHSSTEDSQFFDCWDGVSGVSEGEVTSSSTEASPVHRPYKVKGRGLGQNHGQSQGHPYRKTSTGSASGVVCSPEGLSSPYSTSSLQLQRSQKQEQQRLQQQQSQYSSISTSAASDYQWKEGDQAFVDSEMDEVFSWSESSPGFSPTGCIPVFVQGADDLGQGEGHESISMDRGHTGFYNYSHGLDTGSPQVQNFLCWLIFFFPLLFCLSCLLFI